VELRSLGMVVPGMHGPVGPGPAAALVARGPGCVWHLSREVRRQCNAVTMVGDPARVAWFGQPGERGAGESLAGSRASNDPKYGGHASCSRPGSAVPTRRGMDEESFQSGWAGKGRTWWRVRTRGIVP
jgi:hypothetical protein